MAKRRNLAGWSPQVSADDAQRQLHDCWGAISQACFKLEILANMLGLENPVPPLFRAALHRGQEERNEP